MPSRWIAIAFALAVIVYAALALSADPSFPADLDFERNLCRFHLCANEQLLDWAHEQLWDGNPDSIPSALATFKESLRRDPASAFRWCDLAEAFSRAGDSDKARYCFEQALQLGPKLPPVMLRAAYFFFQLEETTTGLKLMASILNLIREYDAVIFSYYERAEISTELILKHGIPEDAPAARAYFEYLVARQAEPRNLAAVWDWIASRSFDEPPLAALYVDSLLNRGHHEEALNRFSRLTRWYDDKPPRNTIFNPGFERESLGMGFDWKVQPSTQFDTSRDFQVARSGASSLRIRFRGNQNVDYHHTTQRVLVRPGLYTFRAYVRTEQVTTDQGIGFRIRSVDTGPRLELRTDSVVGTMDWAPLEQVLAVGGPARLIEVAVVRTPSMKFDSKIAGTVWIDDVSLEKQ